METASITPATTCYHCGKSYGTHRVGAVTGLRVCLDNRDANGIPTGFRVSPPRHQYPISRGDIEDTARTIARVWFKDQIRNLSSTFYLYWRRARAGERIAIPVLSTERDALSLTEHARGLRVSIAWTEDQAQRQIAEWLMSLPIYGAADLHRPGRGRVGRGAPGD